MDIASGLLLGVLGCSITFVGFMIAFIVATKHMNKKNAKKEPNPVDKLFERW